MFDKTLTAGRTFRDVAPIFRHGTYSSDDMSFGTMHGISGVHTHVHACTISTQQGGIISNYLGLCEQTPKAPRETGYSAD